MSKILFLDFDGVLNSAEWLKKNYDVIRSQSSMLHRDSAEIDPVALVRVRSIVTQTGCDVVVSSSWRILHALDELQDVLMEVDKTGLFLLDVTPDIRTQRRIRGDEIHKWLLEHPGVTKYACLDDDSDFYAHQNLVQTSWEVGIQDEHVTRCVEILK